VSGTSGIDNDICHHRKDNQSVLAGVDHLQGALKLSQIPGHTTLASLGISAPRTVKIAANVRVPDYKDVLGKNLA